MGLFSGSRSSSSTTNNTTQQDARVVGGDASVNSSFALSGSGNRIVMQDSAATGRAFDLAMAGVEANAGLASQAVQQSGELLAGALGKVESLAAGQSEALERIKGADVRALVIVGLLVAGVVGVFALRRVA